MSGSPVEPILDSAQRAASSGDYSRAESLLREVARLQADRLGPQHPDLASTFNNLGVVCERANNLLDAGKFYRQAISIASACLDADDPLLVTSRNNFNEFHRALGLVDTAASPHVDAQAPVGELEDSIRRTAERAHDANIFATAPASTSIRLATGIAIGVALLSALAIWWTRLPVEPGTVQQRVSELGDPLVSVSPSKQSAASQQASTRTIRQRPAVEMVTRRSDPSTEHAASGTTVPASTQGPVQAIEVSVCESLSIVSGRWECTPTSDPAAGVALYFYTRIVSPTTSRIHHRWYQNGVLRHDVSFAVEASRSGYRTFSRRRVDSGDWRVEVVDADGAVLGERRVSVH
jgi:DUF2914 family protein/tetratricopeptide repeat protein